MFKHVNKVSTENVGEEKLKEYKVAGLYNLSVGYQQKISRRITLALKPYVRIPINAYGEQKLSLAQAGMRLKVDF